MRPARRGPGPTRGGGGGRRLGAHRRPVAPPGRGAAPGRASRGAAGPGRARTPGDARHEARDGGDRGGAGPEGRAALHRGPCPPCPAGPLRHRTLGPYRGVLDRGPAPGAGTRAVSGHAARRAPLPADAGLRRGRQGRLRAERAVGAGLDPRRPDVRRSPHGGVAAPRSRRRPRCLVAPGHGSDRAGQPGRGDHGAAAALPADLGRAARGEDRPGPGLCRAACDAGARRPQDRARALPAVSPRGQAPHRALPRYADARPVRPPAGLHRA